MSSFGSSGSLIGRRIGERRRHVQQSVAGGVVAPRRRRCPWPSGASPRTAGSRRARAARSTPRQRHPRRAATRSSCRPRRPSAWSRAEATMMFSPRGGEVDEARAARERRHLVLLVGRRDREHVRQAGRVGERVAVRRRRSPPPRRRAFPCGSPSRSPAGSAISNSVAAEAEVDHARAPRGGGQHSRHDLARRELRALPERRVPRSAGRRRG